MSNIELMDSALDSLDQSGHKITIQDPKVPRPAFNGAINKGNLYINLINIPPGDYSKELFITLLDKAEECGCKNVVVCLNKEASIRPFALLGFRLLPPNHSLIPSEACSKNVLFMGYQLDDGDDL